MGLQQIGLEAILKDADFKKGISNYMGSVSKAEGLTGKATKVIGGAFSLMGKAIVTGIGAGVAAVAGIGAVSVKAAISMESAFAGVIKTTDGLTDEFGNLTELGRELQGGFRDLAKETPIAVEELMAIGELGGQLGVASGDLLSFTEAIAAMGVSTNLTTEEAASGFAQIANIMGTVDKEGSAAFEKLGSTIVALGNNSATTEADILNFAQRIAGAGAIAGLTEANVFGIGAAFASVGVEAEAGGTAVQKVLLGITEAISTQSDDLDNYAKTAGMTAQEFAAMWEVDAAGAFTAFVSGLGAAGDDAIGILDELNLKDQRLTRAFLSLAGAGDVLTDSIDLANGAWDENTALSKEAAQRYATTESQLIIFKNSIKDIGISIGSFILPAFNKLLQFVKPIIDEVGRLIQIFGDVGFDQFFSTFEDGSSYMGGFFEKLGFGKEQAQELGAKFNEFAKNFKTNLINGIQAVQKWWVGAWPKIQKVLKTFWKIASKVFEAVSKWMTKEGPGALDDLKKNFQKVWDYIEKIVKKFTDFWDKNGDKIIKIGKAVFDWFKSSGVKSLQSAWGTITSTFEKAIDAMLSILEVFINVFSGDWEGAWDSIKAYLSTVWDAIIGILEGVIDFILNLFGTNLQEVRSTWENIWNNVKTIAKAIWDNIKSYLSGVWDSIKSTATSIWNTIKSSLESVWYTIKTSATNIWNALRSSVDSILSLLKGSLLTTAENLRTAIATKWDDIRTYAATAWTTLMNQVNGIFTLLKGSIASTLSLIKTNWETQWTNIKTYVLNIWETIKSKIWDAILKIQTWISNIWDTINPFSANLTGTITYDLLTNPGGALMAAPITTNNVVNNNNINMNFTQATDANPATLQMIVSQIVNQQLAKGI